MWPSYRNKTGLANRDTDKSNFVRNQGESLREKETRTDGQTIRAVGSFVRTHRGRLTFTATPAGVPETAVAVPNSGSKNEH